MPEQIPLPVNTDTLRRVFREAGKPNTGRKLSSATISQGGLTVRDKGVLEVTSGGNVTVVDGDLILASGIIQADMLKENIFPQVVTMPRKTLTSLNGAKAGTWGMSPPALTATAPPWASAAIVFAVMTGCLVVDNMDTTPNFYALAAATIEGNRGNPSRFKDETTGSVFLNVPHVVQAIGSYSGLLSGSRTVRIGYALETGDPGHIILPSSWVELQALIIWI